MSAVIQQQQAGGVAMARQPQTIDVAGNRAGSFAEMPRGIILHATRSGRQVDAVTEFWSTVNYVRNGAGGLGWNVTVGPDLLSVHLAPRSWGWNARQHSYEYLAIEFTQARLGDAIADATIDAAAWWINEYVLKIWPRAILANLPEHRELPAGIADGKSDIGSDQRVRERLLARL